MEERSKSRSLAAAKKDKVSKKQRAADMSSKITAFFPKKKVEIAIQPEDTVKEME